ncbi:MAG: hypothetical protein ACTSV7_10005 [Candidatus Baldrarchaeia archaeon]
MDVKNINIIGRQSFTSTSTFTGKIKKLTPCPFLENFKVLDIYVCGTSKHVYVSFSSLSAKEAVNKCTGS